MDNNQKNKALKILLLGICFSSIFLYSIPGHTTATGNFIFYDGPYERDYYPESVYTIKLTNLTVTANYALLIGVNMYEYDWQWINFTATAVTMDLPFQHFDTQVLQDNTSAPLEYLLIYLYAIDTSDVLLDSLTLNIVSVKMQVNDYFIAMILVVLISSLVLITIMYSFIKHFF